MDLGMAVVAWCNAVIRLGRQNLICFEFPVATTRFRISGLEKPAAAATAVIVRPVRVHVDKIFFTHNRFHRIPQIFGHRISKTLSHQLAGILNREFDFQILVPIGIDLQFTFTNPLGIILNDALYFKLVLDLEFFQSDPDCK
jgi:hypothetical protein